MGYDELIQNLAAFDMLLTELKVSFATDSPVKPHFDLVREFVQDHNTHDKEVWGPKWAARFKEFYHAQIVVKRLIDAVLALKAQPPARLKNRLKQVMGGSLTQDFKPDQAKDFFFELELAALWQQSGFKVELTEPDIVLSGNGLSASLAVACKYPSSKKQLHEHISKGYSQIGKQGMTGMVAIGLDQIVFSSMNHYIDFRQRDRPAMDVLLSMLEDLVRELVNERAKDYPAEAPVDGILLTLGVAGILGDPAGLAMLRAVVLQCDNSNPREPDFKRLYDAMPK